VWTEADRDPDPFGREGSRYNQINYVSFDAAVEGRLSKENRVRVDHAIHAEPPIMKTIKVLVS